MGLTSSSVGAGAKNADAELDREENARLIALAGNPNVGKSTLFNALTGMRQHTGNWPGKTVGSAYGTLRQDGQSWIFADIPGTYSLLARSAEEAVARDLLLFGGAEAVAVVCDATCLRRNLNLVLQILEVCGDVVVCVNLLDEAARKGVSVDLKRLSELLGVPVIGMSAGRGRGIDALVPALEGAVQGAQPRPVCCGWELERAMQPLTDYFEAYRPPLPPRWLALRVCEGEASLMESLREHLGMELEDGELAEARAAALENLRALGIDPQRLSDISAQAIGDRAERICGEVVTKKARGAVREERIDRLLTHKIWGWALMLLLLAGALWLTISGANYPSKLLSGALFALGDALGAGLAALGVPERLMSLLCDGVYKTAAWVVAVMLPPMAIFFPLFTLMEDVGLLPRVAFNLDGFFKRCDACGKQALTMSMGFGCNAAGVIGCRIIDSPRERLIAILTNSFVPCNGRFPTMIALITIFFAGSGAAASLRSALMLTGLIVLGVVMTLCASKLLSCTILRGVPSSFTLELPPYRRPKVGEVVVRSVFDRTLFVLVRALKAAAPAGLIIWLLGNVTPGGETVLARCCAFLDPAARLIGMDGAILLAFIVGIPANEIVIPVMLMCYLSGGSLMDYASIAELREILLANGWSAVTGLCVLLFSLMHWPCATTLMTIKKESGSAGYTLLAAALPSACGVIACALVNLAARIFG
ncbi:MAG: ferrous iron transport protein B [Butyricicoccus sp.]|nr:ferrous iron transport protein B [Butyricicoccus sp.]